ncbi:MAG: TPM domain-containing protein, partial [Lachnospiraceae bacterium]|nr:TPM domain-containing protein [Lachnospiraceae bacterium]
MENVQNNFKHSITRIRSLLAIIVLAIIMITLSVNRYTVLADNDEVTNSSDTTGGDNNEVAKSTEKIYVDDAAELIPDGEEVKLVEKCKKLSDKCKVDIGIATTNNAGGLSSKQYAQESVLNNNLGYEDDDRFDKSAVLFLVDLDNKETYIVTEGLGILLIEDDDIENI